MAEKTPRPFQFATIQILRAVATLVIVAAHIAGFVNESFYTPFIFIGHIGVDMFFVISGCVLVHTMYSANGNIKNAGSFVKKRLLRVYSNYWATLIIVAAISFALTIPFTLGESTFHYLFLLPHDSKLHIIPIIWTLSFELMFYIIFTLTICFNRHTKPSTYLMWALIVFTLRIATINSAGFYTEFLTSPFHFEFVMGCLIGLTLQKEKPPAPLIFAIVGTSLWVLSGLNVDLIYNHKQADGIDNTELRSVFMGIPCAIMLYGIAACEKRYRPRIHKFFTLLGDASYSLYLVHFPLFIILVDNKFLRLPPAYLDIALPLLAIALALFHFKFIENPLYKTLTKRSRK